VLGMELSAPATVNCVYVCPIPQQMLGYITRVPACGLLGALLGLSLWYNMASVSLMDSVTNRCIARLP